MRKYHIYIHWQSGSFRDKTSFAVNWLASSFLAGQSNNLADNALMRADFTPPLSAQRDGPFS